MTYPERLVPARLRGSFELVLGLLMIPLSLAPIVLYLTKTPEGYLMYLRGRYALAAPATARLDPADRADAQAAFSRLPVDGVPVLVYHGIGRTWGDTRDSRFVVSRAHFAEQMRALQDAGFQAVDSADLLRFIRTGDRSLLPRRPVLITFDDGRTDAMLQATPILEATHLRATMFVTGKDAGSGSIYYASWGQLSRYAAGGVWELQNHTYDLHQVIDDVKGLQPLSQLVRLQPGETLQHYRARIGADLDHDARAIVSHGGAQPIAFSYPFGDWGQHARAAGVAAALQDVLRSRVRIAFDQDHQSGWRFSMPGDDPMHVHRLQMRDWTASEFLARLHAAAKLSQTTYRERGLDVQVDRRTLVAAAVAAPCAPASDVPVASASTTAKVVALSFNGGLSPYTPQLLDVLKRDDAHGTFFVLGRTVPARSRVLARMLAEGDEIGNATWSGSHAASLTEDALADGAEAHERRGAGRRAVPALPDPAAVQRGHSAARPGRAQPRPDDGALVGRSARPVAERPGGDRAPCAARGRAGSDRAVARRRQRALGDRPGAAADPRRAPPPGLSRRHRVPAPDARLGPGPGGHPVRRALIVSTSVLAVAGASIAAPRGAAAGTTQACTSGPTVLRFVRTPHRPSGVVTWRAPRRLPARAGGYRVFRNGRVVGQTRLAQRRMRVTFRPGRLLRFEVRIALRTGRLTSCKARLTLKPPWQAPGAPGDLVAQAGNDTIALSWQPAARGDGELNGYRLFVDGRVLRQVATTTALVTLSPLHAHTVAVAAVDTQGTLSPLSNTVSVTPGHAPPTTPGPLAAAAAGPSSIRVSWPASTAYGGARVSYRVLRNGRVVGQTTGTAYVVGNLAPGTGYSFTAVAVDSLGYSSPESGAVTATTDAPTKSTGSVHAFLLASTGASFRDLQAHYQQIGTIYPTYYDCLGNGTFVGHDDPLVTAWSRLRGIRVEARFNCQSTATLHALLADPARPRRGDRPDGRPGERLRLGRDQHRLRGRSRRRPRGVHAVHHRGRRRPPRRRQDPVGRRLGEDEGRAEPPALDLLRLRRALRPGRHAVRHVLGDPLAHVGPGGDRRLGRGPRRSRRYVAARPNRAKYVLGFGMYGFDWPAGGGGIHPGTPLEWDDIQSLLARTGGQVVYDATQHAPHFTYTDGYGVPHDVWFTNAQSLGERIALVHSTGVGIGLWRLGDEDQSLWADPLLAPGAAW